MPRHSDFVETNFPDTIRLLNRMTPGQRCCGLILAIIFEACLLFLAGCAIIQSH